MRCGEWPSRSRSASTNCATWSPESRITQNSRALSSSCSNASTPGNGNAKRRRRFRFRRPIDLLIGGRQNERSHSESVEQPARSRHRRVWSHLGCDCGARNRNCPIGGQQCQQCVFVSVEFSSLVRGEQKR